MLFMQAAPRGLAGRVHGWQQQTDKMPMIAITTNNSTSVKPACSGPTNRTQMRYSA